MRKIIVCLSLFCLFFTSLNAIAQEYPVLNTKATITSIDTINYYVVIKAIAKKDGQKLTILSRMDEKSNLLTNYKKSEAVKKDKEYTFVLQQSNVLKVYPGEFLFLNLRSLSIGNLHLLDNGELPYIALNMYQYNIYW